MGCGLGLWAENCGPSRIEVGARTSPDSSMPVVGWRIVCGGDAESSHTPHFFFVMATLRSCPVWVRARARRG